MPQKKGIEFENRLVCVIVEDQINMRHAMRRIIESTGIFRVEEFATVHLALEYLKTHLADLVIADIFLPRGTGFDVLKAIRTRTIANEIPVIFVTGEATQSDIVYAIEQGITSYVIKPFESGDLIAKAVNSVKNYRNPSEKIKKMRQGDAHYLKGFYEQAVLEFREVLDEDPDSVRAMTGLAMAKAKQGRPNEAIDLCERAISLMPMYYQAYAILADVCIECRRFAEARKYLKKELEINGRQSHRRILYADLLLRAKKKKEAAEVIRIAVKEFPQDEMVLLKMGEVFLKTEQYDKAIHYFQKTRRRNPESTKALDGITDVCLKQKDPQKASRIFREIIQRNPRRKDALLALSRLYELEGKYTEALGELESYLLSDSPPLDAHLAKARIFLKTGHLEDAEDVWNMCLQVSLSADTYAKIGMQCVKAQLFQKGVSYLEQASSVDPENKKIRYNLACALEAHGDFARAMVLYEQLAVVSPSNWEVQEALARLRGEPAIEDFDLENKESEEGQDNKSNAA